MLKKLLPLAALVLLPGYSFSESVAPYYGQTGNAASDGNSWDMDTYLPPDIPGLDINGIIYNYTIQKDVDSSVDVTIQNENRRGTGYVFQETDRWRPGSLGGTEINKVVPIVPLNREHWGTGSITVDGQGSVEDPNVVYMYRVDPCYDPQFDPNCPGYEVQMPDIPEVDLSTIYDPTVDSQIVQYEDKAQYSDDEELSDDEKKERESEEEKDSSERLEKALAAAENSALFAQSLAAAQQLEALNRATEMNSYYSTTIPGGNYTDTVTLNNKRIPENRKGLRNGLAQQILHEKMIDMQYKN